MPAQTGCRQDACAPRRLILSLFVAVMIAASSIPVASKPPEPSPCVLLEPSGFDSQEDAKPDYAPIVERKMEFQDFAYQTTDGLSFNLRDYAKGKSIVIIEYFAGWCANSNRNGHIVERLWTKYRERGIGVVGVAEYSDPDELRIHINRIGIDYPIVIETNRQGQRKDSSHYKYRRAVGDKRKWGTPFYVIIDTRDIEAVAGNALLARRVYTVSGELVESEVDQFIRQRLTNAELK